MAPRRKIAKPLQRLTLKQLLRATPSDIKSRAGTQCRVIRKEYAAGSRDNFKRVYVRNRTYYNEFRAWVACTDGRRNTYLRFYGPPDANSECWAWCSCPYFCVDGSTIISTSNGLQPIRQTVGEVTTLTKNGPKSAETFSTGTAETLKITAQGGFQLRATPNERFLMLTTDLKQIWKRLDELKPDDYVAIQPGAVWPEKSAKFPWTYAPAMKIPYKKRISGKVRTVKRRPVNAQIHTTPAKMTPELARILGYLTADGHGDKYTIKFSQKTGKVLDDYMQCWERTFPTTNLSIETSEQNEKTASCRSMYLIRFFREALGYDTKLCAHQKCVPASILQATKKHAIEFLHAYYESDGSNQQIAASSASEKLAVEIQQLLLALGIKANHATDYPKHTITANKSAAQTFLSTVGFISKKPQLEADVSRHGRRIPHVRKILRDCAQSAGYYQVGNRKMCLNLWDHKMFGAYYDGGTTDNLTEYALERYMQCDYGKNLKLIYPTAHKRIMALLNSSMEWVKIEKIGEPKTVPTFDTMVPDGHNFVANGFVVHNTYNLEVALARRNTSVVRNSNGELPRVRNPAMIPHLCKHLVLIAGAAVKEQEDLAAARMAEEQGVAEEATKEAAAKKMKPNRISKLRKRALAAPKNSTKFVDLT